MDINKIYKKITLDPKTKKRIDWRDQFTEEFGIHFKDAPAELKFAITFIEDLLDECEIALAEVIDDLYLIFKDEICDWGDETHNLGRFKELIKMRFHDRLKDLTIRYPSGKL